MKALTSVAIAANVFAIVFYFSPIIILIKLIKTKEIKTVPSLLFFFTLLNCQLWFIYGVQDKSWEVYFNNFIGFFLNTIYLSIFLFYLIDIRKKITFLILIYGLIIIIFYYMMYVIDNKSITGFLAMILNIFMLLSPLQKTYEVFKYKNNEYISLSTISSLFVCTTLWMTVGILKNNDIYIIIPNSIGVAISLFQIFLYFIFKDHPQKHQIMKNIETPRIEKGEDGCTNVIQEKFENI